MDTRGSWAIIVSMGNGGALKKKPGKIAVIGLGYVGLPLAVALAEHFPTVGYDIDKERIKTLNAGHDWTNEVTDKDLKKSPLKFSAVKDILKGADVFIITTPTPIGTNHQPDLGPVLSACKSIARYLSKGAVVILESTVYPGVTEMKCGPELESGTSLRCGEDFFLGYSPERTNPGDKIHTIHKITKVIAGQTEAVTDLMEVIYGAITHGNVFRAKNIKAAEASKVIENAQRDLNIAFINEAAIIFNQAGFSIYDVLDAAKTKWNFLDFKPGLVGGHCIGVDPYYLAYFAEEVGFEADLILTARRTNDAMAGFIAGDISKKLKHGSRVLILGLTFKEDVPDLRNSRAVDLIWALKERGLNVDVYDPIADPEEVHREYGIRLVDSLTIKNAADRYDAVVGTVSHRAFCKLKAKELEGLLKKDGLVGDIKGIWRGLEFSKGIRRWCL